jgi:hypothetical protein
MSATGIKYKLRARVLKTARRSVAMFLCLTLVFRMLSLNFPALCPFTDSLPPDELKTERYHKALAEYSTLNIVDDLSAAMVKDSSESNEETFSKSSKYPVLLVFLAFAKLLGAPLLLGLLLAAFCFQATILKRHLTFSILRI